MLSYTYMCYIFLLYDSSSEAAGREGVSVKGLSSTLSYKNIKGLDGKL